VRRAVVRDLDRARALGAADVPSLSIKLDETARLVDELPMLSQPERRNPHELHAAKAGKVAVAASAAASSASAAAGGWSLWPTLLSDWAQSFWAEARSLIRISRIERPEAMLISPEQSFFLRENLKLRLLNARLALLSRQFDLAQSDLAQAQDVLGRYFDRSSRRVVVAQELLAQVASQSRQVSVPRPEETLAALAAAAAGR
jgi:uroporphyrin-3 C-methyltransferase